jgi:hypothetical protein
MPLAARSIKPCGVAGASALDLGEAQVPVPSLATAQSSLTKKILEQGGDWRYSDGPATPMRIRELRPDTYNGWQFILYRIDSHYGLPATSFRQFLVL